MPTIFYHLGIAIATFAITNIDDLMILSVYFSQPKYKVRDIFIGQYLGVISLIIISLSGIVLGQFINPNWISLLGFFPIIIGVKDLFLLLKPKKEKDETQRNELEVKKKIHNQIFNIALVTFANGGDNLGVYTPLFAATHISYISLYIAVFLVMIGVWCLTAHYLVKHPFVKNLIAKFGEWLLPIFLIVLGITIVVQ